MKLENFSFLVLDLILVSLLALLFYTQRSQLKPFKKSAIKTIVSTSLFLLIIDFIFTHNQYWMYHSGAIVGLTIFKVPIEKLVFTPTILAISLIIYLFIKRKLDYTNRKWVVRLLCFLFIILTIPFPYIHWYDFHTFLSSLLLNFFLLFLLYKTPKWSTNFLVLFTTTLYPFVALSSFISGTDWNAPLLTFNALETQGVFIFSFPLENLFYWFAVLFVGIYLFESLERKQQI